MSWTLQPDNRVEVGGSKPFSFSITAARKMYFAASSQEEMQEWVQAIQHAIDVLNTPMAAGYIKQLKRMKENAN